MSKEQVVVALEVVEIATDEIIRTIPIKPPSTAERVMRGLLVNMDRDRFFVREKYGVVP